MSENPLTQLDLALARDAISPPVGELPPVIAIVRLDHQHKYPEASPEIVDAAFDRLIASREAGIMEVNMVKRTRVEAQALVARVDVVLTARLDGFLLALAAGVPTVAVDPVPGGAILLAKAKTIAWPAALPVDAIDDAELERLLTWCLMPEGRERALAYTQVGIDNIERMLAELAEQF